MNRDPIALEKRWTDGESWPNDFVEKVNRGEDLRWVGSRCPWRMHNFRWNNPLGTSTQNVYTFCGKFYQSVQRGYNSQTGLINNNMPIHLKITLPCWGLNGKSCTGGVWISPGIAHYILTLLFYTLSHFKIWMWPDNAFYMHASVSKVSSSHWNIFSCDQKWAGTFQNCL